MIRYSINSSDCNNFELDMISNAKIDGLLMPISVESNKDGEIILSYKEPIGKTRLQILIDDNYFDLNRYHDFLSKIIVLKTRLETYMLNPQNIHFNIEAIWYDPIVCEFQFIYLPKIDKDSHQELNLYRHIFIESSQIMEINLNLLKELKQNSFDLDHFCTVLNKPTAIIKGNKSWFRIFGSKKQTYSVPESKTIQKSRKPCLLDANNPTVFHEIHFNHNSLGRGDDCNIKIDDSSISRRHAIIYKNKLDFSIEDLDSSNGTYHNGQTVNGCTILVNGDKLQFGDKEFIFIL